MAVNASFTNKANSTSSGQYVEAKMAPVEWLKPVLPAVCRHEKKREAQNFYSASNAKFSCYP